MVLKEYNPTIPMIGGINMFGVLVMFHFIFSFVSSCDARIKGAPYPTSPVIENISWDFTSLRRAAIGSDLWPITWANDNTLFTAWGDGGGFGGTNRDGRSSLGVAQTKGSGANWQGFNIFGGKNSESKANFSGKPTGLIYIDRVLYMGVVEQNKWLRWKIGRSTDHGRTWIFNGTPFSSYWDFAEPDGAFSDTVFLNFGKNYQGARDGYVYAYSQDHRALSSQHDIAMFRVPKEHIMDRKYYEYFAGIDTYGKPRWTSDISKRAPVFTDTNGIGWGVRVDFNPVLHRYFLTTWHGYDGSWGVFDAPEPWGPWTTVAYYERWIDSIPKFGFSFPQKWISKDGKTLWMVFSGEGIYDSFNVIKARFTLK
ncbi:MAG: DUF4185 domain-containing protein [Desulfobacteraceae bacterium]|nr:DUF4185 domain-containing protein [Desulfobacteraceae bacterium]